MSSKGRRWEKSASAEAQSPMSQINALVEGMSESDRAAHRAAYLHLIQSMAGTSVNVDCVDGNKFSGVFHTSTPFQGKPHVVVVKAARFSEGEASPSRGANDGKTVALDFGKIATVQANNKIDLVSRNYSSEFQTDAAIKKHGNMSYLEGRELQGIDSSWLETSGDMSLEGKTTSGKQWDQFETNRRLFNVKDTYDENLYTKRLDLKSMTAEQIARAERLAREIEGSASSNVHLQEERGQICETDMDEEDRYSGVLRTPEGGTNTGNASRRSGGASASATAADAGNPWKRGTKLTGAAATAATTAANGATTSGTTSKSISPPPGVTLSGPAPGLSANNSSKKSNTAAPTAAATAAPTPAAKKNTTAAVPTAAVVSAEPSKDTTSAEKKADAPAAAAAAAAAAAPAAEGGGGSTAASASTPPVVAEAPKKPATALRAAAAEFKPSWMSSPAAAPAAAPLPMAVPVHTMPPGAMQPMGFAPAPYGNVPPYNVPMTPDGNMYPQQNKIHNSPGAHVMTSPVMAPMAGPDGYPYDPSLMAQLPPQGYPQFTADGQMFYPNMPMGFPGGGGAMNPNMMMGSPGGEFMMPPMMPMYPDPQMGGGFYPGNGMPPMPPNMAMGGNMPGMMMMNQPPNMMYGGGNPQQQQMYPPQQMGGVGMNGYNSPGPKQGMGPMSGDKSGGRGGRGGRGQNYNNNGGGRGGGYGGRGYNNNNNNGMSSPQTMGMQGPGTPGSGGAANAGPATGGPGGEGNADGSS